MTFSCKPRTFESNLSAALIANEVVTVFRGTSIRLNALRFDLIVTRLWQEMTQFADSIVQGLQFLLSYLVRLLGSAFMGLAGTADRVAVERTAGSMSSNRYSKYIFIIFSPFQIVLTTCLLLLTLFVKESDFFFHELHVRRPNSLRQS